MHKKLKVALLAPITNDIPPVGYGPWELVVYNLAESLVKLRVDVTVFGTRKTQTSAKLDYIVEKPLIETDEQSRTYFANKHIAYTLVKSKGFDIVHNHLNIHPVLLSNTISVPMVTTLHGSASEKNNAAYYKRWKNANFISISYAERSFMPQLNYIANVYNGVDFTKYKIKDSSGKYFVFSGRLVKEKGILSAIEIAKKTKIPLRIAGIITDRYFFDTQIKPHIDGTLISFLGNLQYPQIVSLLQEALATLYLAQWEEPFGLSALDSLACGVPVIATGKGALPELVYDKNMGIIIKDVDEAIDRLDEIRDVDSLTCSHMAQTKFSREIMAKDYLQNYLKLVKK